MSNPKKKMTKGERKKRAIAMRRAQNTIWIVLAVIILIAFIWMVVSGMQDNQATQNQTEATPTVATEQDEQTGQGPKQYASPPPMTIDENKQYFATVKMAKGGEFVIQLFPDKAPITVNSFVFLAREGYFDGVTFHRVIDGFMAQSGDPTGTGGGSPGYKFVNEDSDLTFDKDGVVAMANAGRDTNGSQFFITYGPQEYLNGDYTIFGQVIEGMEVVDGLTRRDPKQNPSYTGDVIESITIEEK
jgi:cyclophilin family peptidyl-prolyl cis-trans isomerase